MCEPEAGGGREPQANSMLSTEPDGGLNPTSMTSGPEPQSRVRCTTDGAPPGAPGVPSTCWFSVPKGLTHSCSLHFGDSFARNLFFSSVRPGGCTTSCPDPVGCFRATSDTQFTSLMKPSPPASCRPSCPCRGFPCASLHLRLPEPAPRPPAVGSVSHGLCVHLTEPSARAALQRTASLV